MVSKKTNKLHSFRICEACLIKVHGVIGVHDQFCIVKSTDGEYAVASPKLTRDGRDYNTFDFIRTIPSVVKDENGCTYLISAIMGSYMNGRGDCIESGLYVELEKMLNGACNVPYYDTDHLDTEWYLGHNYNLNLV